MKKLIILSIFLFVPCKKETQIKKEKEIQTEEVIEVGFVASQINTPLDTLKSDLLNRVKFKYRNTEFEKYPKGRYIAVYYVIQDSFYKPIENINDLEKYKYGVLSNAKQTDTIVIDTFKEKEDKIVTFVVYDEILVPVGRDSANIRTLISNYGYEIFIK